MRSMSHDYYQQPQLHTEATATLESKRWTVDDNLDFMTTTSECSTWFVTANVASTSSRLAKSSTCTLISYWNMGIHLWTIPTTQSLDFVWTFKCGRRPFVFINDWQPFVFINDKQHLKPFVFYMVIIFLSQTK